MNVITNYVNKVINWLEKCCLTVWIKRFVSDVKNEEVKITHDVDLWSHRMIESLMRDIDILRNRIQKVEQDLRAKK